jgi:hypothetical protein
MLQLLKTLIDHFSRASTISSIRSQLGFFSLIVLVIEIPLLVLVNKATGFDFTLLIISMVGLLILLVIIVAYVRPDIFRQRLLNDEIIKTIENIARTHHDDYIRIACAHTVWSCRPDRAKPLLEDAKRDEAEVVRDHAKNILARYY